MEKRRMEAFQARSHRGGLGAAALCFVACVLLLVVAPAAEAGVYQVLECDRNFEPLDAPDAVYFEEASGFQASNNNCQDEPEFSLRVDHGSADIPDGKRAYWYFLSPTGTAFVAVKLQADLVGGDDGLKAKLVMSDDRDDDHPSRLVFAQGGGGFTAKSWLSTGYEQGQGGPARRYFLAELKCQGSASQGSACSNNSSGAHTRVRDLNFHLRDSASPQIAQAGTLLSGGWVKGARTLSYSAADEGGGLRVVRLVVNGNDAMQTVPCEVLTNPSTVATRLQPCPLSRAEELGADTTGGPFRDGVNTVRQCAIDFPGDHNGNETCTPEETVLIDNTAPGNPQGLSLAGGSDWRPQNDFDLSWTNPDQGDASPIAGAVYRLTEQGGGHDSGPQFVAGQGRTSLDNVQVPRAGEYALRVWLRDEAGNESEAEAETVILRFDDRNPEVAFMDGQDPNDPDEIRANVGDGDSGVAGGTISYRRSGEASWQDLDTSLEGGQLVARISSDDLERNRSYEFMAEASDRAGNFSTTTDRVGGSPMVLTMPIKIQTEVGTHLTDPPRCSGEDSCLKIRYGRSISIAGRLKSNGIGVANEPVTIHEQMRAGAMPETRETTVVTGDDGRFGLTLPAGPSREITARYVGSKQLGRSFSDPITGTVRSHLTFNRFPSAVLNGHRVEFYGAVGTLGASIPSGGKLIAIQYLDTRGRDTYRTIALVRTDPSGSYSYRYRFRSIRRPTRIRFRSKAVSEATWPYRKSRSTSSRTVTVYP